MTPATLDAQGLRLALEGTDKVLLQVLRLMDTGVSLNALREILRREERELSNYLRTGERTPDNTLAVRR